METDKQMTAGAIGGRQGSSNSLGWVVRRGQVGLLRVPLPLSLVRQTGGVVEILLKRKKKLRTNFFVTKFLFVREKWFFVFVLLSISSKTFNNFFMKYRKKFLPYSHDFCPMIWKTVILILNPGMNTFFRAFYCSFFYHWDQELRYKNVKLLYVLCHVLCVMRWRIHMQVTIFRIMR